MNRKQVLGTMVAGAAGVAGAGLLAGVGAVLAGRAIWNAVNSTPLAGKTVLITGASRGLGLALAEECAAQGCRLAICAHNEESLQKAEEHLSRCGADVLALRCDVTQRDEIDRMVHDVIAHYGHIDILINNAGTIAVGPFNSQTLEDFEEAMNVMFWGPVHTTLAVLPHMLERHQGQIANITSIGGRMAVPHLLAYSAAKFAITGFSEGLTAELANRGIRVTTVIPGLMRTGSHINAFFKGDHQAEYTWFGISASTPVLAMNAERAARRIVRAIRRGDAELILGAPAKLAALAHGIAPAITVRALSLVNRVLPECDDNSKDRHLGRESESLATKSPLTTLGKRAAKRWNQKQVA